MKKEEEEKGKKKKKVIVLGKDGKPFDQVRYEDWVLHSKNVSLTLPPFRGGKKGNGIIKWDCPIHGIVRGGAIKEHKRECL